MESPVASDGESPVEQSRKEIIVVGVKGAEGEANRPIQIPQPDIVEPPLICSSLNQVVFLHFVSKFCLKPF